MARKRCVERKRYPCTVKASLESRFWTRSTTAKASKHSGGVTEARNVESGESRVSTLAT